VERNRHGADHGLDLGIGRGIALVVRTREINLVLAREVNSELSGGEAVETAEGKEPDDIVEILRHREVIEGVLPQGNELGSSSLAPPEQPLGCVSWKIARMMGTLAVSMALIWKEI